MRSDKSVGSTFEQSHTFCRLVRGKMLDSYCKSDAQTYSILSKDPSRFFSSVRSMKRSSNQSIKELTVRDKLYPEHMVGDGLYDSISFLKTEAHAGLELSETYSEGLQTYKHIIALCENNQKIPQISLEKSEEILNKIRPSVNDLFSITGHHYKYADDEGLLHFHELMNAVIAELNNASLAELNEVWACVLHKGHGKDRTSERSYRTISTCPFISKGLDTLISDLYSPVWDKEQAPTQFQGKCSSHELASLLITELVQYSLHVSRKPLYILYLDARSAFDLVVREFLIANLYHYGISDQGLCLIDLRLKNRKTFCEWERSLMGPIDDLWGLEQGGKNSSDFYKVYNNSQILAAQESELGVCLGGDIVVSAVGQADDIALASNNIHNLQYLLDLSLDYCRRNLVSLSSEKTKLQAYSNISTQNQAYYDKTISPVNIDNKVIPFTDEAEHVGVTRSTHGNLAHILNRFTSHKKAIAAVSPLGLGRRRRVNPAASIRVQQLYGTPVLLSGISLLFLKKFEIDTINQYMKRVVQHHQKLPDSTPASVIAFLGGTLPGKAVIHLKQLNTFGMITRMPGSVLHTHGYQVLTRLSSPMSSRFFQIRDICLEYGLPNPLDLLSDPPSKPSFNRKIKSFVIDHWEKKLRSEASELDSLVFFQPKYMSLASPHPIWTACGSNPFEVHKASFTVKMLAGRYLTDMLQRHWTPNKSGCCLLPGCAQSRTPGTLQHLLLYCPSLAERRQKLLLLATRISSEHEALSPILRHFFSETTGPKETMQLLIDYTVIPSIVNLVQTHGTSIRDRLLYLGRTWCYGIYCERMTQFGLLKFR